MKPDEKVFVIVYRIKDNSLELLALKPTPEPNRSVADYVITGGVEEYDDSFEYAALREVAEEIGIKSSNIIGLEYTIDYTDHITLKQYSEHCFGVKIYEERIILNEEHIGYRWLNEDDFIHTIWWDYDKSILEQMIEIIETHENLTVATHNFKK
jgi:8-oxo-dGTP pyrophosphatase MutT (NUDIX family)